MSYFKINSLFLMLLLAYSGKAQSDTLSISIAQADNVFLSTNYQLLATSLNIDVQKAQVLQASLYPNPVLTLDMNAIDPENNKIFHLGNSGQQSIQLEQLILLGGKRKAQIDLAKTNVEMAEFAFQDLIRQLKFELHTGLYLLNQQQILIGKYSKQMAMVDNIISTYEYQAHKGNIPLKDVVRLKGVYLNLSNERASIYGDYFHQLSKVQTLLQTKSIVVPKVTDADIQSFIQPFDVQLLIDQALENRPDLLLGKKDAVFAEQYFTLQKKLAKPDITLFSSYDQRGGAFQRQVNLGLAIPLMFWNKNQGNIKSAETQIKAKHLFVEGLKSQVIAEVQNTYWQYKQTVAEYLKNNKLYDEDFEITLKGMTENFQKGNVSLIEFVDFFESYNNALSEISRIKMQLATSAEQIKLSTGKELF
ncbi:TolC family protein [Aquirufa aurantiipilula]|uniref:TolC family protein n=1 Tax=Aquirufa aurantiipilula TaxID=2696561 RepID=A0ABT6BH12_9BACT|nr:TolC family protein [Aquirufa aurantiipilula]MDF5689553.1 TolC family protein [Aquirufa aurantiipilula]